MRFKNFYKRNCRNILFKVIVAIGESVKKIYENRNYNCETNGEEFLLQKFVGKNIRVIFDVGANIGSWTNLCTKYHPNANIYSFEPIPETYKALEIIGRTNDKIHTYNIGLGSENKNVEFKFYQESHELCSQFSFKHGEASKTISVTLKAGDSFMLESKIEVIDFLKIDTEGADLDVLKGFIETLKNKKIRIIQFEYGQINIVSKNLLYDFYQFLESHGYVVGKIYPKFVSFKKYKYSMEDFLGPNYLAVHESEVDIIKALS